MICARGANGEGDTDADVDAIAMGAGGGCGSSSRRGGGGGCIGGCISGAGTIVEYRSAALVTDGDLDFLAHGKKR